MLFFEDCPHWPEADRRLREALRLAGRPDVEVMHRRITTEQAAGPGQFHGSPTIVIDGQDPFGAGRAARSGSACRLYDTPDGLQGAPTVAQLRAALA